ncbi:GIDE domain-containing protein [Polaribacter porphyrae]|uniref:Uncharacterized protein n=1 Tax=Polaribacter porphyrae TaxID=1137780 RepID=A0A2S7WQS6_9FLAO|nr:GIDE domain-containing protein [Polaribacter porphyrae]PQJ79796.1 hypothetical protein BTO18_11695 [Polaribacter porphyrae]
MIFLIIDNIKFIILAVFIIIIIIIASSIYFFSTKQKIIRILSKLPIKQFGSLKANEFSRVKGKALHIKEPLVAPFSKRKCVFYSIKIEQKKSNGKSSHWKTLVKEEQIQDFFLEKNGDYVMVKPKQNPKNYMSHLVIDKKVSSGTFNDASQEFEQLLKNYNIKSTGFLGFNKQIRYTEGIIEIGEEITVAGIAKWKNLKEPIKGFNYSKIVELESSEKQKLIITDLPNIKSKKRL